MPIRFSEAIAAVLLVVSSLAYASGTAEFYGDKEDGWFWYKDPAELRPKPEQKPQVQAEAEASKQPKEASPVPFSVEWLRVNMDRLRDDAIEHPEDKNKVKAYLYAVRVMMDKAQNFADAAHDIANSDPLLDNNNRIPLGSASKSMILNIQDQDRRKILAFLSQRVGLWFFFDGKCSYCQGQIRLLKTFKELNPAYQIRNVSMDGGVLPGMVGEVVRDQGQAKRLGLTITPTLVMVSPPNTYAIVAQGMITSAELEEKILLSARMAKIIPDDMLKKFQIFNRGVLKPEDFNGAKEGVDMNDPAAWVNFLQDKLKGSY